MQTSSTHDETRRKLMDAAGEVFAETGYQTATVREICRRAGANLAAVNYHFGDKLGLYTELLKAIVGSEAIIMEDELRTLSPDEALRRFLHGMMRQLSQADRPCWYTRMMAHELAQPTAALEAVVEHVIRPRGLILYGIVGRILDRPPLDPRTRMCAHSIIGQVVHYIHARPVIALLWTELKMTPNAIEEIADHITEFSLEALKGIKRNAHRPAPKARRSK
ncbi:MAG: CerR family C-terminal domain-containing protein [Terriglobales bacterium]|jgi:AcrR family transcriptional regulator